MAALKAARDEYQRNPLPTQRAITAEQFAELDPGNPGGLLNRWLALEADLDTAKAAQANVTAALAAAAAELRMYVSHFHQVLDLAITRGVFDAGVRSLYGREVNATALPDLKTYPALDNAAAALVQGETRRLAANPAAIPLAFPSAAEVKTRHDRFTPLRAVSRQRQTATDFAREAFAALLPAAQELARDLADTIEFHYRKDKDRSSRRAKCARWGVVYR